MGPHSLPCEGHGRQLMGPIRRPRGHTAATTAFSRVVLASATSMDMLRDGFALRNLRWDGPQRRISDSRLAGPIGTTAVDPSANLCLLCRARFWSAIPSAPFGEHMGDSRAVAKRRPCGLLPATTA